MTHVHCDRMKDGGREHCGHNPCCHCGYVRPEPEIPPEIEDLLWDLTHSAWQGTGEKHNREIAEAFNRGRRRKEQP